MHKMKTPTCQYQESSSKLLRDVGRSSEPPWDSKSTLHDCNERTLHHQLILDLENFLLMTCWECNKGYCVIKTKRDNRNKSLSNWQLLTKHFLKIKKIKDKDYILNISPVKDYSHILHLLVENM